MQIPVVATTGGLDTISDALLEKDAVDLIFVLLALS